MKTESEGGGLGNLGSLGAALASSLVNFNTSQSNMHAQQGYPPQQSNSGVLGSILGALGIIYIYIFNTIYVNIIN